ncbi:hypothetical protein WQE_19839 [Paraburkholderia hospita]|uniref:Uncharacterized protein n=1 Tax=Paraburkholderia hospita TaxID=169430 RepID=A0ABP2PNB7_9BURK|nr:hypothetical protein [Paraburkholderia hospita]EIM99284.1 hypothetical protein WQE_19839 [Paraburkholderia hospita]OUL87674.1 hypothetical protein CA602_13125 [Paraburkholderia hospita]
MKVRLQTIVSRLAFVALAVATSHAYAATTFDGVQAQQMEVSYQAGTMNDVVGVVSNRSSQEVDVTVKFKGYTADGLLSQGNPSATIAHLGAGESARFECGGFFGRVTKISLIHVRTTAAH